MDQICMLCSDSAKSTTSSEPELGDYEVDEYEDNDYGDYELDPTDEVGCRAEWCPSKGNSVHQD